MVTTRRDLPIETVALRMFSRWQQENFFRYMRHEFALDHLPTTAVEPADPQRSVPNPAVKEQKARVWVGSRPSWRRPSRPTANTHMRTRSRRSARFEGSRSPMPSLAPKIKELRAERDPLEAELKALPQRVPVREIDGWRAGRAARARAQDHHRYVQDGLPTAPRSQLANLVGPLLPYRDDEARKFMRQVFELPADLLPDYEQGTLVVRMHSMTTPRDNHVLATLCGVLNDLAVCYPGTELRLVLEATQPSLESR